MAITAVAGQTANAFNNPVSTLNVVLPNRPQPGNMVTLSVAMGIAAFLVSVIDSNGNVYDVSSQSPAQLAGAARVYVCYLPDAPFNASATITANVSAATDLTIHAIEVTGQDNDNLINVEALHTNNAGTSTNVNDPTITPTKDNCFLFFGCACDALSVNSPWTTVGAIVNGNISEYLIQTKAAAQAVSITQNNGVWIGVAVAFNAAPTPVVNARYNPADDESGWISEMTQITEWWGVDISLKGWLDADFVPAPAPAVGIGTAAGTSAANGVGKAASSAVGTAAGISDAPGVGRAASSTVGTTAGVGAASGVGKAASTVVGATSGVGAASGVASGTSAAIGTAAGVGTPTGVGRAASNTVGTVAGIGAATGVGRAASTVIGTIAGFGVMSGVASGTSAAIGTISGVGIANGIAFLTSSIGTAFGASTVNGIGKSASSAIGSMSASSEMIGYGASLGWIPNGTPDGDWNSVIQLSGTWVAAADVDEDWQPVPLFADAWVPITPNIEDWANHG